MKHIIRYLFLLKVKYLAKSFYRFNLSANFPFKDYQHEDWRKINLVIFLNHTSLFEPVMLGVAPNSLLKHIAHNLVAPAADITLNRPFVGKLYKALIPGCIPISRKKDESWQYFLDQVSEDKLTAILPEGRMKRRTGLDKHGKPMTIKAGVVDILSKLTSGKILFVYSGGLHHIQAPGDRLPKVFKEIDLGLEVIDIEAYKAKFDSKLHKNFKHFVLDDLHQRLALCEKKS